MLMKNMEYISEADLAAFAEIGTPDEIEATDHAADHFTVYPELPDGKKRVEVSYHQGDRDSNLLILRALPITEHPSRDYESGRNAALANASGAHVIAMGNLSTLGSSNLNSAQVDELTRAKRYKPDEGLPWRSTFRSVGRTLGRATKEAVQLTNLDGEKLADMTVVADFVSLGNNVGAALLHELDGDLHPDIVIWREMVDKGLPVDLRSFQSEFREHGSARMKEYRDRNRLLAPDRHDRLIVGGARFLLNPRANLHHYPAGIAGGSIIGDLRESYESGRLSADTVHVTVTGSESVVAPIGAASGLRHNLVQNMGMAAAGIEVEGATHLAYNAYDLNAAMVLRAMQLAEDA